MKKIINSTFILFCLGLIISCSKEDYEIQTISNLENSNKSILTNQKSIPDSLSGQINFGQKNYIINVNNG